MNQNEKSYKPFSMYIKIASIFVTFYLSLRLLIFPIITSIETGKLAKIPEITPSDVCLLLLIILFQTDLLNLIKTLKIGSGGFEAEFRELKQEVDKQKEDIDTLQQQQIELIQQQQKKLDSLQTFMFNFLLDESKYKIIHFLNLYTAQNLPFSFHVTPNAAIDLRILRDFKLIELIDPKSYISQMETDSNRGYKAIY
ncbi:MULTISPECIES: hypothetical protein [Okeania]|uniref:Uncharacterized protein n=1 Tax=Okeania hirsuta TaxID=1458930 RepID=A0A3N6PK55_9CYAN|nr:MULTISPECIES: hypothetical protein [Okeania]NES78443.1 hypothetical protein [Okeania sp. SIO1H4]NES88402.1 hypothetical protein [Okeania sp. SIO2B9]NET21744.1 hypothetical protein [Okeania sp. SIO1H5]NET76919.1 hypothetical protein [Okeania sp. SIO1F9]NET96877.1 hypothetical protein [Okeania sp. SIO1H2]